MCIYNIFLKNIWIASCENLHVDNMKNAKSSDNTMSSKGYVNCLQSVLQYYWRGGLLYWSKVSPSVCILRPVEKKWLFGIANKILVMEKLQDLGIPC